MTLAQGIALFIAAYLALLARSAWKQNELPQFLRSLGVVAMLIAAIAVVTWTYLRLTDAW